MDIRVFASRRGRTPVRRTRRTIAVTLATLVGAGAFYSQLHTSEAAPIAASIAFSTTPNRANARLLNGTVVDGSIHVYVYSRYATRSVTFSLDDPKFAAPTIDTSWPYDLVSGSTRAAAQPYDTRRLVNGRHALYVRVVNTRNQARSISASFEVRNVDTTTTPGAEPAGEPTAVPTTIAPPTSVPTSATTRVTTPPPTTSAPKPTTTTTKPKSPPPTAPPTVIPPAPPRPSSFPDATNTGVPAGVSLTPYTGPNPITAANTVIDGVVFPGGITIQAPNVVIRRSKLNDAIDLGHTTNWNATFEDVEVDGHNSISAGIGGRGFTCRRCNIHGFMQGIQASNFVLEDSYIHDLYGTGTVHSEAVLGKDGNIVLRHNELQGKYNGASGGFDPNDGGMSSAVSFYTHGDFWGPINNILVENNRLSTDDTGRGQAGFCLYAGDDNGIGSSTHEVSNAIFRNNVFVRTAGTNHCGAYGEVTQFLNGNGNVWQANVRDDGSPVNP